MLTATNLYKKYSVARKDVVVLSGASMDVGDGEAVAVVGASGAGKSTLLHLLGGLDRPDAGTVKVNGAELYAMTGSERTRLRARGLGFVFQSYHLLPEMDVWQNVMLPAMALGHDFRVGKARERARALLQAVGLADRARHRPLELSGGEQQRVALARAMMNEPALVLADEPTGNLDAETSDQVLQYLFTLTRQAGHALVLVTHNHDTASRCDRTLSLQDGLING
ncbi:MAG: ABC transporter ATP-binding protein [Verrucomicrobia bacterium]|nr:ABC transporter ATP-binding protein [Verrucomicrobiota bacterium]